MVDAYKHNPAEVQSIISSLTTQLNNYNDKINELQNLVLKIESSQLWVDAVLKTSFISACNSYITIYTNVSTKLDSYIKYLTKKSAGAESLEKSFSG